MPTASLAQYKRPAEKRIFVNRSLRMEKIKYFGFDMDYTLAPYKSPAMEVLAFDLTLQRLVHIGYPKEVLTFKYNPIFPVRGLWFDMQYGNLLKVDSFGNIMQGMHGLNYLKTVEIEELYPNKWIQLSDSRVYVLNTLFNLPETCIVAQLVDFYDSNAAFARMDDRTGVRSGDELVMTYRSIFEDIRSAVDYVHIHGSMKETIMKNLEKYVVKDSRIVLMLRQLREAGKTSFLLTNSDCEYTDAIMTYLIGDDWPMHFSITIVDAAKPRWFADSSTFREVDRRTGRVKVGVHASTNLKQGVIYSGGSCDAFRRCIQTRGKDVLYFGDHIFGDVLRSKKTRGWRTFLVVPELDRELRVWTDRRDAFERLDSFENQLSEIYKNLDGRSRDKPEIASIVNSIRSISHEMDQEYGMMGSLFRCGGRTTFFGAQVERYADLYASTCFNLVHYPSFYFFRAPMTLMPHEATVDHASVMHRPVLGHQQSSVGEQVRELAQRSGSATNLAEFAHEEEDEERSVSDDEKKAQIAAQQLQQQQLHNGKAANGTGVNNNAVAEDETKDGGRQRGTSTSDESTTSSSGAAAKIGTQSNGKLDVALAPTHVDEQIVSHH